MPAIDSIDNKLLLIEAYMIALGANMKTAKEHFPHEIEDAVYELEERVAIQEKKLTGTQEDVITALKETDMPGYFEAMRRLKKQYQEGQIDMAQQERVDELRERIEERERNMTALDRSPEHTQLVEKHLDRMAEIQQRLREDFCITNEERYAYLAFAIIGLHELHRRGYMDALTLHMHAQELQEQIKKKMDEMPPPFTPYRIIKTYGKELKDIGVLLN
jgi:hypothetical protein